MKCTYLRQLIEYCVIQQIKNEMSLLSIVTPECREKKKLHYDGKASSWTKKRSSIVF